MGKRGVLWHAVLLALGAGMAWAAEVDFSADERLEVKVSVSQGSATVEDVLKEVSRQTGVPLQAGRTPDDWFSRELPLSVFVKDVTAREVLSRLGKLTDFHWSEFTADGVRGYQLWQDLQGRQRQTRTREEHERAEQVRQTRQALGNLESFARIGKLSEIDLEKLAESDPMAAVLGTQPGFRGMTRVIGALTPQQQLQATTSEGLRIPYDQLSPALQADVKSFVTGLRDFVGRMEAVEGRSRREEQRWDRNPDLSKAELVIRGPRGQGERIGTRVVTTGEFRVEGAGNGPSDFPLFDTNSGFGKLFGRLITQMMQGTPPSHLEAMMRTEVSNLVLSGGFGEATPEPPEDPELTKTVKLELKAPEGDRDRNPTVADLLEALHKATGWSLLADRLPSPADQGPPFGPALATEMPRYRLLHLLESLYGLTYEKSGAFLVLRDADWAGKREGLIPQALLKDWGAKARSEEGLTLGEMMEMASLSEAQIEGGLRSDPDLRSASYMLRYRNRALLQLLSSLTPQQASRLLSPEKLPVSSLSEEQWSLLEAAWRGNDSDRGKDTPLSPETVLAAQLPVTAPEDSTQPEPDQAPLAQRRFIHIQVLAVTVDDGSVTTSEVDSFGLFAPQPRVERPAPPPSAQPSQQSRPESPPQPRRATP